MDIINAEKEFIKYTSNYDVNDTNIKRKIDHSIRVEKISSNLANKLNLKKEYAEIATLIGLLHDIGRFEQYRRYNLFSDYKTNLDHGDLGVEILKENNYLREYIEENSYDEIILKAIKNHNKFMIENNLNDEELLFCKLIRDSDKIDILFEAVTMFWENKTDIIEDSYLSQEIIDNFKMHKLIERKQEETVLDGVFDVIAFVFDINFKESFEIIKKEDYINKIIDRFTFKDLNTRKQVEELRKIANDFVEEKIKKG